MNHLAQESSPYLASHAANPVEWYPWGEEAFSRARSEDRPILLSVGYSSCHWCHVMAHESFEDEETAAVMNAHFVNIKVDREERPDVDALYMEATQALTGRGGWPMTVFLTPEGRPFFAGTYFPKRAHGGLPAFTDLLRSVSNAWIDQRDEVISQADTLTTSLQDASRFSRAKSGGELAELTSKARAESGGELAEASGKASSALRAWMTRSWDPGFGGFGRAPKFPQSAVIDTALAMARTGGSDDEALAIATTTLAGMASGGIYDHLGGGFARYSTDERWLVPHFEKMLYDQASLLRVYLHGWQVTSDARWRQVVDETVAYVLRDLAMAGGGLASAEDADSPDPAMGVPTTPDSEKRREDGAIAHGNVNREGAYYLWRAKEVRELLPESLADPFCDWYGVTWKGNVSGRMEGGDGLNILHRPPGAPLVRPAEVEEARKHLFEARNTRPRPGLDTKVLTEWNAMFLSSLAEAAAATGNSGWKEAGQELGEFLWSSLRRTDGRWMRSFQDGTQRHLAYAADHAWVVDAFTRLYELTGRALWLDRATATGHALLELFWDAEEGGFFTAGVDADRMVVRTKEPFDGSTPSASAASASSLWRLGTLTGETRFTLAAERTLSALADHLVSNPAACAHALAAAELVTGGATEVVVTGTRPDLVEVIQRAWLPGAVLAWGEPCAGPLWEGRGESGEDGRAYVCTGYTCRAPAADPAELAGLLGILPVM